MIWPTVLSIYVLIGSGCLAGTVQATRHQSTAQAPFNLTTAFVVIFGTVALWPLLVAVALDQAATDRRNNGR